ncbi:MAG: hypothetical protein QXD78_07325 [Candidatus Bathyarchaeia archaeon]
MTMLAEWIYMSVAIFIAELSYLLGIILYAAPIPYPSIKSAAREFMEDSGKLIVGLLVIDLFLYITSLQFSYVEGALLDYTNRADSTIAEMAHLQKVTVGGVSIFGVAVFAIFLLIRLFRNAFIITPEDVREGMQLAARVCSIVAKILSPVCMLYGVVVLIQILFKAYCELIFRHWTTLVGLGILLYLIPFKIGRPAAKFLIGFGMISYLMIPLYNEVSKLFHAWIERTIRILLWFPIKIAVFDVIFPLFYFGLVAWLLGAIASVSWSPIQYGMGLSWITPIRRFMRAGVSSIEKLGKAAAGFIPKKKGEEEEEGEGRPPSEGRGPPGGKGKPPEEGGETEGGGGRRTPPHAEEEVHPKEEGGEYAPSMPQYPYTQPPSEEAMLQPREKISQVPEQEIALEGIVGKKELEEERVNDTLLKMRRDLPESIKEEARDVLTELPLDYRRGVNSVSIGEPSPIYGASGQYFPPTKEVKVYEEGVALNKTKDILRHGIGHGVFFNMPPEKRREFFEALNRAIASGYRVDRRAFINPETAGHEAFAHTYTRYHEGKPVHKALAKFMRSYHGEYLTEMRPSVGVEEGSLGEAEKTGTGQGG